jgi:hypothetical protein
MIIFNMNITNCSDTVFSCSGISRDLMLGLQQRVMELVLEAGP